MSVGKVQTTDDSGRFGTHGLAPVALGTSRCFKFEATPAFFTSGMDLAAVPGWKGFLQSLVVMTLNFPPTSQCLASFSQQLVLGRHAAGRLVFVDTLCGSRIDVLPDAPSGCSVPAVLSAKQHVRVDCCVTVEEQHRVAPKFSCGPHGDEALDAGAGERVCCGEKHPTKAEARHCHRLCNLDVLGCACGPHGDEAFDGDAGERVSCGKKHPTKSVAKICCRRCNLDVLGLACGPHGGKAGDFGAGESCGRKHPTKRGAQNCHRRCNAAPKAAKGTKRAASALQSSHPHDQSQSLFPNFEVNHMTSAGRSAWSAGRVFPQAVRETRTSSETEQQTEPPRPGGSTTTSTMATGRGATTRDVPEASQRRGMTDDNQRQGRL